MWLQTIWGSEWVVQSLQSGISHKFALKYFSYDHLKSLVINCTVLTSNKATTRHKKAFRNAIWLRSDIKMHMFCSCYLTADKSLRHTTVQYNVWFWPLLPDSLRAKGKHANLSSQQVLWQRGRPPSPSASAAVEFRPCTLQPMAQTLGQTTLVRLSMRRHVCNLSEGRGEQMCNRGSWWIREGWINKRYQLWLATTKFGGEIKNTWLCHDEVYCGCLTG